MRILKRAGKARGLLAHVPGTPRVWLALFTAFFCLAVFEEITDDVFHDPREGDFESEQLDKRVSDFVTQYRSKRLTQAAVDITALGSVTVLSVVAFLFGAATLWRRDRLAFLHLVVALAGALTLPRLLKLHFSRTRPGFAEHLVNVSDLSFPSGHSFGAAAAYVTFAFLGARYARSLGWESFSYVFAAALILSVGLTRIYLGVHYFSDVVAGLSGGVAWACLVAAAFSWFYRREPKISAPKAARPRG